MAKPSNKRPRFTPNLAIPTKDTLISGIRQWVCQRVEGEVHFTYLHQLTFEDLMLLARAMGYQGHGSQPVPARPIPTRPSREIPPVVEGGTDATQA